MPKGKSLSAAYVKTVTEPGRHGDGRGGNGLVLRVYRMSNGRLSKCWLQRLRLNGQTFDMGLGSYPKVSLATARQRAANNAQLVAEDCDPRTPVAVVPTFAEALETVIGLHRDSWKEGGKTEQSWRSTLGDHAIPILGHKPVSEITSADVHDVLTPIWSNHRPTALKVRQRVSAVMKWSKAQGYRGDDPAGDAITEALPQGGHTTTHHRALPFAEVGAAIATIRDTGAWPATKGAFEFLTLTAARSKEVRLAEWEEIDLDTATWTVPASHMKKNREHRVPLSRQALAVVETARGETTEVTGLIFPSQHGKALTDSTISKLVRENDIDCVPHGMRSSFRDWAAECSSVDPQIADHAIAHVVGSASARAYRRTDFFDKRRTLMQEWADFVLPTDGSSPERQIPSSGQPR